MAQSMVSFNEITVTTADGAKVALSSYRGSVLLIVNVASRCGFTEHYRQLEVWHQRYQARGFSVLAFPCNQFGGQEPGTNAQIQSFCQTRFAVTFPVFAKIDVKGPNQHPLYRYLTEQKRGLLGSKSVKWNFTQFLCSREGQVVERFSPTESNRVIEHAIQRHL